MRQGLIGHTGFVGGTLARQHRFDALFNSRNIEEIAGQRFDVLVCAGAPAAKWLANKEPEQDRANLDRLRHALERCSAGVLVLVSTIDVYPHPSGVDEGSPIDHRASEPYGRHRRELELFVAERFRKAAIVRLPALFGAGLKKNFLFDLLHQQCLDWTHADSAFQFYDMERLWADCETILQADLPLVNLATEPVRARTVAERCFGIDFANVTSKPPAAYDMQTRHAATFGGSGAYIASADAVLAGIAAFAEAARAVRP